MEGDDKEDRKRRHPLEDDYYRPKTSRPDKDDHQREGQSRSRVDPRTVGDGGNGVGSRIDYQGSSQDYSRRDNRDSSRDGSGRSHRDGSGGSSRDSSRNISERDYRDNSRDGSGRDSRDRSRDDPRIQNRDMVRPEERDRSRNRDDTGSRQPEHSPGGYHRSGNGASRDGYPSHGRGGSHPSQIVRISRNREEATAPQRPSRPADQYSGFERPRDRSATKPTAELCSSGERGRSFSRERPGEESPGSVSRTGSFSSSTVSPNGSSGSGNRGGVCREPSSSTGALESRGRGYGRERSSPTLTFEGQDRPSPSSSSGYREESNLQKRPSPEGCPPEFIGGGFPDDGSVGGDPESGIQGERPSPEVCSQGEAGGHPSPERSSGMRGRGFSRDRPGFSGQRPSGSRPEGTVRGNLQNMAATSTVDMNDPNQKKGGRRGQRPPRPSDAQMADFVKTKPKHIEDKKARTSPRVPLEEVTLVSNYYKMLSRNKWNLYHYHVDFPPEIDRTNDKRNLFKVHAHKLRGWHIFDGSALYTAHELRPDELEFYSARERREEKILVKINRNPTRVDASADINIQIYNIIIRCCMRELALVQIGRHYYNPGEKSVFNHQKLEIWPGYKTSIRQHENELLLCVEMTNKVIQKETVLNVLYGYGDDRETAKGELLGCVVMTRYNSRTYRIDDIKFDETPATTFPFQGEEKSFADYIQLKYPHRDNRVKDMTQPILYSKAKRKDIRRGMTGNIALIPELCYMTGLRDAQRSNFKFMRDLNHCLQLNPNDRVSHIQKFSRLLDVQDIRKKVLHPAGLEVGRDLVQVPAHIFKPEDIQVGNGTLPLQRERYDWGGAVVHKPMFQTVPLTKWAVIVTQRDQANVDTFVRLIQQGARTMGFRINEFKRFLANGRGAQAFLSQIDSIVQEGKGQVQMIMCILPTADESIYGEIKRKCYMDYGIPSQCVLAKNVAPNAGNRNKQKGVADKLTIQMNAKLGGVPWKVAWPSKGTMSAGFNISALGRQRGSNARQSVGALVATINPDQTKYFSCIVDQEQGQTLSTLLGAKLVQAVDAYFKANESLPSQILFYRDGMGDGQLQSVKDTEVQEIENRLKEFYEAKSISAPKLIFIVVNKRLSTKFFSKDSRGQYKNPLPGTAVDDVVTLPERYDFYLLPTKGTGQGTLCPTAFNVIHDTSSLRPEQIQVLTYKLCHLYFNWTSTVSVPAPCQYAHKLAFLQNLMNKTGRRSGRSEPKPQLSNTLFYL